MGIRISGVHFGRQGIRRVRAEIGQHRVGHIMAGRADKLALVVAAVAHIVIGRGGVGEGSAFGIAVRRVHEHLSAGVFGVGGADRPVVGVKSRLIHEGQHGADQRVGHHRVAGRGLRQRADLVPIVRPFRPFANTGKGVGIKRIHHRMAHRAVDAVIIAAGHERGIGRIGAALQPAFGKVATEAKVGGVGCAEGPNRILRGDGHGSPEQGIARGLGHHRTHPIGAGGTGGGGEMARHAGAGVFERNRTRLIARHANEGVIGDGQW